MTFPPRDRAVHPPAAHPPYRTTALRAPARPLVRLAPSPSETTGPVFAAEIGTSDDLTTNFARPGHTAQGARILVHGRVADEAGRPVPGAMIEVWQANAGGRYRHAKDGYLAPLDPDFGGCGRVRTDAEGCYRFLTVRPGPYPWPNGPNTWRPAHIHFSLFGFAFAQRLVTQMYFEGDPLIPLCPIAGAIPDRYALDRLTARLDPEAARPFDALAWRFDVTLRGPAATPAEAP